MNVRSSLKTFLKTSVLLTTFLIGHPSQCADDRDSIYDKSFREKITSDWNAPGTGNVDVAFNITQDGKVTNILAHDSSGQAPPTEFIKRLIVSKQPYAPLPPLYSSRKTVWMNINWAEKGHSTSGPYFYATLPSYIKKGLGLESIPFESKLGGKISDSAQRSTIEGSATVYLKLQMNNGAISKIFIVTEPKNPAIEKEAYAIVQRAHPFGPVPAGETYYKVNMKWGKNLQSSSPFVVKNPPAWLK